MNLEIEEYKNKIRLISQDKDQILNSQRSQLQEILQKVFFIHYSSFYRKFQIKNQNLIKISQI